MGYVVRRWLGALSSVMLMSLAVPAQARTSTGSIGASYAYPDRVVQTYLEACGGTATDRVSQPIMQAVCVCTIEEFQTSFSLRTFQQMGQAIKAGREVPEMDQIMSDCARQVMLRPDI
jgi:hypothetical protein